MNSRTLVASTIAFLIAGTAVAAPTPEPAAESPHLSACAGPKAACAANQAAAARSWKMAMAGDRVAQRDLAAILARGADGVAAAPVRACAWRIVIAEARGPSGADVANLRADCGRLGAAGQADAERLARAIAARIG
ncbi:hypothetical protein [Caulobacter sp. 17J80-11]|uniref:hypothetical protein n=1 Tax=Caulobacter sp. 17J80-11 TaxID=2763502 RepID=UPI0016537153|nr:hypothetical protein [Caulobacter sp. 17J80-11]MBC6981549.1 hypothetical protein [Caulobacter sp. 17J80-11]